MTERSWERLGAASGLVSMSLLLLTIFISPALRSGDAAAIVAYFADNHTRVQLVRIAGMSLATMTMIHILPAAALASLTKRPGEVDTSVVLALYDLHTLSLGAVGLLVALIGLVGGVATFFVTGAAVMGMPYVLGMPFGLWLGVTSLVMLYRPEVDHGRVPAAVFAR